MNYPWHETQWKKFLKQYQQQTLPHALLLYGPSGLAKKQFALRLAKTVLCAQQTELPCEQCHSCKLLAAGNHPDFLLIEPEDKSIGITQIRELISQLQLTQHTAEYKIIIINPASCMTHAASNAILKSLEEPPAARTILILITEAIALLPATIVSRCQRMSFSSPNQTIIMEWLKGQVKEMPTTQDLTTLAMHFDNAPLRILAALTHEETHQISTLQTELDNLLIKKSNPISLARQWQNFSILTLLDWILVWSHLKIKQQLNNQLNCQRVFAFIDEVQQIKRTVLRKVTLNQLLLLESLFIKCQDMSLC